MKQYQHIAVLFAMYHVSHDIKSKFQLSPETKIFEIY